MPSARAAAESAVPATNRRELLEENAALLTAGTLRPVVDEVFAMERITNAHRRVEGRHKLGSVIVRMASNGTAEAALRSPPVVESF